MPPARYISWSSSELRNNGPVSGRLSTSATIGALPGRFSDVELKESFALLASGPEGLVVVQGIDFV